MNGNLTENPRLIYRVTCSSQSEALKVCADRVHLTAFRKESARIRNLYPDNPFYSTRMEEQDPSIKDHPMFGLCVEYITTFIREVNDGTFL